MSDAPGNEAPGKDSPDDAPGIAQGWHWGWRLVAGVACGLMMVVGSPDYDLWWLGFVAWVPWLWALDGQRPKAAYLYGLTAGFTSVFVGFFWMTELLTRFAGLPMWAAAGTHVLFALWQGQTWGLASLTAAAVQRRTGRSLLWIAPLAWLAFESIMPAIFPVYMALMWCFSPLWIQLAELGGAGTVTFAMVAINTALYLVIRGWFTEGKLERGPAIAFAAWMIGVPTYGAIRMAQVDAIAAERPVLKVGVVQGNFGIKTFGDPKAKRAILRDMQRTTARLEDQGADVAVWGETAYPYAAFFRASEKDLPKKHRLRVRRGFTIPLVFGAVTHDHTGENPYPWNTAMVLESDGSIGDRYDKVYPLMFGESVPLVDPDWYLEKVPSASYLNPGPGPGVLEVGEYRLGPLICYEDILPRYARQVAKQDIHAFVNLTNDSWFGKSNEQGEHMGLAVFRAIEHRKPLVRAVDAGTSVYGDPAGRVHHRTDVTDSDVDGWKGGVGFVAEVPMMDPEARTLYGLAGDLLNGVGILALIVLAWRRREDEGGDAAAPTATADPEPQD